MSDSVIRLKELLFDTETRALNDVQERLERVTRLEQEASERLDAVFSRAGTDDRLSTAVAEVLHGALRTAQVARHDELADAVAPLVVRTIKTEIINSRDEMVEALYPITGRMVKAYVASAFADMLAQINRRVDSNPFMLRLRSLVSGRSVTELAFTDTNKPRITDVYLIRRGTGELIGRWPNEAGNEREQVMSGVLAAINEFASEAFGDGSAALRQIDLDNTRVYVRASPIYLLAAKCMGAAPEPAQQLIDSAFLSAIEDANAQGRLGTANQPLSRLYTSLNDDIADLMRQEQRSRVSPAFVLLCLVGLALAGWVGWTTFGRYKTAQTQASVEQAIADTRGIAGYPIDIDVEERGRRVRLSGLAPDDGVKTALLGRVRAGLPSVMIEDHVNVLPAAHGELGDAIERAAIETALARATQRLSDVLADLPRLDAVVDGEASDRILARARSHAEDGVRSLHERTALSRSATAQRDLAEKLRVVATDLSGLVSGIELPSPPNKESPGRPPGMVDHARELESAADRLANVTAAVLHARAVQKSQPPPVPAIVRAPDITAFERLSVFVRSHAIFFSDDLALRDEARAGSALDELARLMKETDAYLRVVGYTDAKGAASRNDELSLKRAQTVGEALTSRGVPAERVITVGRHDANQISADIGETSTNRRVEFEIGFDGERRE